MKEYRKEIIICFIALIAAGGAIWFFIRSLQHEKESREINLFEVVASEVDILFQINRISPFNRMIKDNLSLQSKVSGFIPPVFLKMLQVPDISSTSPLFSFHGKEIIFYNHITGAQANFLTKKYLPAIFPYYSPQSYEKYGVRFIYYPDKRNRFFGYFYTDGLWVASYSSKLLEEVARSYVTGKGSFSYNESSNEHVVDSHSPINLFIKGELPDICFKEGENAAWKLTNYWIGCDIFLSESNICLFTSFDPSIIPEQWIDPLAATFTEEINRFIPGLTLSYQLEPEQLIYLYTACSPAH